MNIATLAGTAVGCAPAGWARADVIAYASGSAEIRFTGWEEFTSGQPFGPAGLTFLNNHPGYGGSQGAPPGNIASLMGLGSGPHGPATGHAPSPGTGWDASTLFDLRLTGPATATGTITSTLFLNFLNATSGSSSYILRGTVSVWMDIDSSASVWPSSNATVFGNISAISRSSGGIAFVNGVSMSNSSLGPGLHHAQSLDLPFELTIPAEPDGFAELKIEFHMTGSAFLIPAPGAAALLLSGCIAAARRRRS